jgi:hypothetical protein
VGNLETNGRKPAGSKIETLKNFAGWSVFAAFFVGLVFVLDYAFL